MKNINTNQLTQGLIDLIINLSTNRSQNYSQLFYLLDKFSTSKYQSIDSSILNLFRSLNRKVPAMRKDSSASIGIAFKLVENQNNSVVKTETWLVKRMSHSSSGLQQSQAEFQRSLKLILSGIISTCQKMIQDENCFESASSELDNCTISYQISTNPIQFSLGRDKTEISSHILDTEYRIQTYTQKYHPNIQQSLFDTKMYKKSSCTAASVSEAQDAGRMRKLSFHSYYDEENDVTFLSNESLSLGEDQNIEDVLCEGNQDDEEYQFEIVISEEDEKTRQFKESLRQFEALGLDF